MVVRTKTIKEKIISYDINFDDTINIFNKALTYFMEVIDANFVDLTGVTTKEIVHAVEKLTHATKVNPLPKYQDFDVIFYKFPSYFRRATISTAFGKIKSYRSLLKNWMDEKSFALASGRKFGKAQPTFQLEQNEYPVFYEGNMFKDKTSKTAKIKLYLRNDWVWVELNIKPHKIERRNVSDWKVCSPKLIKTGKKFFLATPCQKNIELNKTKIEDQIIISVDKGLTNSAVCSAMASNGTVIDRLFINQPIEKDRLDVHLKKVSMAQREFGYIKAPNLWRRINGLQNHIKVDTSRKIVNFAVKHNASVIVFEHLGNLRLGNLRGVKRMAQRLHHWQHQGIQTLVEEMAQYNGMRISKINPANTSKLAFDGSGEVKRSQRGDLSIFKNGKVYHADLSASYNIGARYFIKELFKTLPEKVKSTLKAKVPELSARTQQSLSSLIRLHQAATSNGVTLLG